MNYFKYILASLLILPILACEKVIDIPINDAPDKIVVEAFTSNIEGRSYVKLSKTGNVYTINNFDKVSDASVEITDNTGTVFTFSEDQNTPGTYTLPGFKVEENQTYSLKIIAEGEEITGISKSSFIPTLDLVVGIPISTITLNPNDTARIVAYSFNDPVQTGDNYRLIVSVNGEVDPTYYIGNDVLGSGLQVEGVFFATSVDSGDVVEVELLTMDKANYDYYFSLVNNTSTGPFAASPANPVSNLSDNALGYFGAYLMDTTKIVVD